MFITKEERNAGIDLLRILSTFMVIVQHILYHGGILSSNLGGGKYFVVYFLECLCLTAVNLFALVSGYLNYNKKFSIKRILKLYFQVFFINFVISLFFICFKVEDLTPELIISMIFPMLSTQYWYFTCYFALMIIAPFLNVLIEKTDKSCVLSILFIVGFGIGILALFKYFFTLFDFGSGFSVSWLAYLYLVGGVINKYNLKIKLFENNKYMYILLYLIFAVAELALSQIFYSSLESHNLFLYTNIFNILNSVLLLMFFSNIKIKGNKFILILSGTSFGVYLIHEQPLIRKYFMLNQFEFFTNANTFVLLILILFTTLLIYFVAAILELLRYKLFKVMKINCLINKIESQFAKECDEVNNFLNKTQEK